MTNKVKITSEVKKLGVWEKIPSDSVNSMKIEFEFAEDWADLICVAQFTQGEHTYNMLITDNECIVPAELTAGEFKLSVFGTKSDGTAYKATSVPLEEEIYESGFVGDGDTPIPPTPDLYEQLLNEIASQDKITEPSSTTINLFNKNSVVDGVITDTGITTNASYKASDFIYLGAGKNIACSWLASAQNPRSMVFYGENKTTVIAYYKTAPSPANYPAETFRHSQDDNGRNCTVVPIPNGAVYVRVSVLATALDNYMIYTLAENEISRPADYVAYNSGYINKVNLRIEQPNYIKSYFNSKKAVFLGDSITAGYSLVGTEKPFPAIVASNLNMTYVNYGIGGSEIAQFAEGDNTYNPMCIRYADMDNDADLVIVAGGTNDWSHDHTQMGTMGDTSINTFYGAMDTLCKGLLAKYAGKTIAFMTPIKRWAGKGTNKEYYKPNSLGYKLEDFVNAIKEVCGFYGIPVIDMFNECSLNPLIDEIYTNYIPDGSHPNRKGQIVMAKRVTAGIQALCQSTYEI